jgi:predicted PilT family ATPase
MQRVTLVRYTVKPDQGMENEELARAVFTELKEAAPKNVAYALFRNADEFVHLFVNSTDEDSSPVTELSSFKAYVKEIGARCVSPPEQTRLALHLLESYGLTAAKA